MSIQLRLCLHLLFALFAVFLASPNSLAMPMAALPTKSVHLAVFNSVTTTMTGESVLRSGGETGLSEERLGPAGAFRARPIGIPKPNYGIFVEIGRTVAAEETVTGFRAVSDDELSQIINENRFYSPANSSTPTGNLGKFFYTDQGAAQQAANVFAKESGVN